MDQEGWKTLANTAILKTYSPHLFNIKEPFDKDDDYLMFQVRHKATHFTDKRIIEQLKLRPYKEYTDYHIKCIECLECNMDNRYVIVRGIITFRKREK